MLGLWVTLESPAVTEIAAELGFDWVTIDTEHGHLGPREVLEHLRAASGSQTSVLVRVSHLNEEPIKRALDMGADGILVPLVRAASDVRRALACSLYPPDGARTVGVERAFRWGLKTSDYLEVANTDVAVVPIIETREAMEAFDEILQVGGFPAVFFGPGDLSASLGYVGEWEGPGVADLILDARGRAEARAIASGLVARDLEDVLLRVEQGFRMLAIGPDTRLLIDRAAEIVEQVRNYRTPRRA
ncbi:MAG: 2-dehydro-3-deoxyglucarate aldolase [Gaiellaceae bacterium]|nr:2-dehydro-3-deoxyglucarate aldolase [Gaiellaceae bacterium]